MVEIITYEVLYDILRREKYERELQKLEKDFFQSVIKYLDEKEAIVSSQKNKESLFAKESEKTQKQVDNIRKILREIYEKREGKIVQHALISSRFNEANLPNMLSEETLFYNQIKLVLNKYRKDILENLLSKKLPEIKEIPKEVQTEKEVVLINKEQKNIKLLRILEPIPQFIGEDSVVYGPFESEDMASLPLNMANLLINKNKAEEINPS